MKNLTFSCLFLINSFLLTGQTNFDVKLKPTAVFFESSIAAQAEVSLGPWISAIGGFGYNDTKLFPNLYNVFYNTVIGDDASDSGLLFEGGFRYYTRPYFGMDQAFITGLLKYQGPNKYLANSSGTPGIAINVGTKHVFHSKIFVETFIGWSFGTFLEGSNVGSVSIRSSMPLLMYGVNVGYRISGDTTRGTPAYYGKSNNQIKSSKAKATSKNKNSTSKKSSSSKKKKKKKKRRG